MMMERIPGKTGVLIFNCISKRPDVSVFNGSGGGCRAPDLQQLKIPQTAVFYDRILHQMASPPPPCEGNCEHGDRLYGKNPFAYDGSLCGCQRCQNFEVCGEWSPPWVYDCHAGRCRSCNMMFMNDLVVEEVAGPVLDLP
jgi:hypothetical protein